MSDLTSPEHTITSPPPGVSVRALGPAPALDALLDGAVGGSDDLVGRHLEQALAGRTLLEHRWDGADEPVVFPLVVTDGAALMATFSIPLEQAWALLPATERLVPVRTTPRRAAVAFFAWEIRRGSLGPRRELGVGLPVLLDAPKVPGPVPPSLWRDPSLGLYVVELPVDDERACAAGRALLGLPHVVGRSEMEVDPRGGRSAFANDHGDLASFEVRLGRWARQRTIDVSYRTYSLLGGRIVSTRHVGVGEGYRGRRGEATVTFGEHRRAQRIERLSLSRRPLELRVLPRLNWLTEAPEDVGAA